MNKKIHFCCGKRKLDGWQNYDKDVDIRKPLPFEDESVDYLFCEHGLEHVYFKEGYEFLKECKRILKDGGVFRVAIPCIDVMMERVDSKYLELKSKRIKWMKKLNITEMNIETAIYQIMFGWKHRTVYTIDLLTSVGSSIGFEYEVCGIRNSKHEVLNNIDYHNKMEVDETSESYHKYYCQTGIVEFTKSLKNI